MTSHHDTEYPAMATHDGIGGDVTTSHVQRAASESAATGTVVTVGVQSRSRSVTFGQVSKDKNLEKRRLQRTPTPYWPRKEVGCDDIDDVTDFSDYGPVDGEYGEESRESFPAARFHSNGSDNDEGVCDDHNGESDDGIEKDDDSKKRATVTFSLTGIQVERDCPRKSQEGTAIRGPHADRAKRLGRLSRSENTFDEDDIPELHRNPLFQKAAAAGDDGKAEIHGNGNLDMALVKNG